MLPQLHINDRKAIANQLELPLEDFDGLVSSANHAYDFLKIMGPFYGKEYISDPTFRTTAEPVRLPIDAKPLFKSLGDDLIHLGKALPKLPSAYKKMLGLGLDFRIPVMWRIDSIIDTEGNIKVNEIEGKDGASALMMIEQLAYGLQSMKQTTVGRLIKFLQNSYEISEKKGPLHIAIIRTGVPGDPYALNTKRLIEMIHELSQGMILCSLYDTDDLTSGTVAPDWTQYSAIFNETNLSPQEINDMGVPMENVLAAGNYDALVNKGVFALVHELALQPFWEKTIGLERLKRLQSLLIPSKFITTKEELENARKDGKVVKVTWAEGNMMVANRSKGVAMPTGDITQSTTERWEYLQECLEIGYTIIAQDYVEPKRLFAYLRKKETSLEPVEWYNRLCVKYVCNKNPNIHDTVIAHVTAAEVTLGPDVIPAGRRCAFTAGSFI